jgi:hypothetical protein
MKRQRTKVEPFIPGVTLERPGAFKPQNLRPHPLTIKDRKEVKTRYRKEMREGDADWNKHSRIINLKD